MEQYFGNWENREQMLESFEANASELKDAIVIAAAYDTGNYEGDAFVVYRKEGKLYEVHGSHCSCNGLEGQWSPEETTYEALVDRLEKTEKYEIEKFGEEFYNALKRGLVDEMFEREVLYS